METSIGGGQQVGSQDTLVNEPSLNMDGSYVGDVMAEGIDAIV